MKRGDDYKELKENIAQRLLAELYKQQPQLEGAVEYYELSTPLTTQHFINYEKGEIYGLDATPERFRQKFLKPRTPIKKLLPDRTRHRHLRSRRRSLLRSANRNRDDWGKCYEEGDEALNLGSENVEVLRSGKMLVLSRLCAIIQLL
jgi:hypothetical protein